MADQEITGLVMPYWKKTVVRTKGQKGTLERWLSRYVRLRATDGSGVCHCFTCFHIGHPKEFEDGHYVKRNRASLRHDERNNQAQCWHCNNALEGNAGVYARRLDETYGPGTAESLEAMGSLTGGLRGADVKRRSDEFRKLTYQTTPILWGFS